MSSQAVAPQRRFRAAATLACLLALATASARAETPEARGEDYSARYCSGCHAIGRQGQSPYRAAPPFRILPSHLDPNVLTARLAHTLGRDHYGMPRRFLTTREAADLTAYITSLREPDDGADLRTIAPCLATAWC